MRRNDGATRAIAKAPTGIRGLDEIPGGGLPRGRPTLVCGSAGSRLQRNELERGLFRFDRLDDAPAVVVIRRIPPPLRRIVGDLANTERVLVGLQIEPRED